jgi:hypothetical protein
VQLLGRTDDAARTVDAEHHGLDLGIVAVRFQLAEHVVDIDDGPLELHDGHPCAEDRAAAARRRETRR